MKVNLDTISKRALGFIKNPQFSKPDLNGDFQVTLDSHDKILTVFHREILGDLELIFNEGLAIFSKHRTVDELWKINFREFENFLRDENHLPAFSEVTPELEEMLNSVKITLIASIIKSQMGAGLASLSVSLFHWENLSLVAKNIWAQDFLAFLGWQLVFCDEQTLTVTKTPVGVAGDDLEFFLKKIFEGAGSGLPVKVVAV